LLSANRRHGGSNTDHFDIMLNNPGRLLPVAVKWAIAHGEPASPDC
jgi:hypothetical protein